MKKIYKLKQWYSFNDASKRLTQTLSETINETDLLELTIEGHIQLHWYMRQVPCIEVAFSFHEIQPLKLKDNDFSDKPDKNEKIFVPGYYSVNPDGNVSHLNGAHILLLDQCGALSDYLRSLLTGTGGELISLEGFYVEDGNGKMWNILERFNDSDIKEEKTFEGRYWQNYYNYKYYFPSGEWPEFSELGFTKTELENFESSLNDKSKNEIKNREKTTLLKMLIGMAIDGYGFDPNASRSPLPKELEGNLDTLGLSVSDDTIRKWLKEAAEHLPQNNEPD